MFTKRAFDRLKTHQEQGMVGEEAWIGVVTAEEMKRVEEGGDLEAFMQEAGRKAAEAVVERAAGTVGVLVGKGNNGGDGFAAACCLIERGVRVRLFALYGEEESSSLNRLFAKKFAAVGGKIERTLNLNGIDLILDALLGTGFRGELAQEIEAWIRVANESGKPIIAIDIPSGLNGTTGEGRLAIQAVETVALGFAKIGFFLGKGWNWVGKLRVENFGLSEAAVKRAHLTARIPKLASLKLPKPERVCHKYERGLVVGFGGSRAYQGAMKLSGMAALRSGAGMVRIFSLEELGAAPSELICQIWNEQSWRESLEKAKAVFIGPGMGRSEAALNWLERNLGTLEKPCVIDADALYFLSNLKKWPAQCVLTPHRGEMRHMAGDDSLTASQQFVDEKNVVLVLKGAPTFIFSKGQIPVVAPWGDPGMATAGAGDVLTGVISSLCAQSKNLVEAALLGVVLHALAGEAAAASRTSFGVAAEDLIENLPKAFRQLGG